MTGRGPLGKDFRAHGTDDTPTRARTRRTLVVASALVALAATAAALAARQFRTRPPNVVVVVLDTVRADRCSIDGYDRPTTPRLAEFAREATVFRDAWSPANWTGSAHASLFTGLRAEHHGFHEGNVLFLQDGFDTLASLLDDAGYATASFSNNCVVAPQFGLTRGFRNVESLFSRPARAYPWARATHEEALAWACGEARAGRPFFLFVNDMEPHQPYEPPADAATRFVRSDPPSTVMAEARSYGFPKTIAYDIGAVELTPARLGLLSDLYDAEVATLDAELGSLLDGLRTEGLLDSTLVVIVADHGENLGDHHLIEHSLGLHRTLCRVPLVARLPGVFDGGRVVRDVVRLEDVFPTVLETCGVDVPRGIDGVSLMHDLPGRVARAMQPVQEQQRPGLTEMFGASAALTRLLRGVDSVYDGRYHLLAYSDGTEELFDVERDPGELVDVRAREPDVAVRLRALLAPTVAGAAPAGPSAMSK